MMGCARNLTNILRLYIVFDFEEKVIKLLRHQTSIMFLAKALKNIPQKSFDSESTDDSSLNSESFTSLPACYIQSVPKR